MARRRTLLWRAMTMAMGGSVVAAVVGSVGFAIDSWQGLAWAIGGPVPGPRPSRSGLTRPGRCRAGAWRAG